MKHILQNTRFSGFYSHTCKMLSYTLSLPILEIMCINNLSALQS